MSERVFFAKSERANGTRPTVAQHLEAVARKASEYGEDAQLSKPAELAGLFHDFGKYSEAFQKVLRAESSHIDHAVCGAAMLYECWNNPSTGGKRAVIEAVNGHHAGLTDYDTLKSSLKSICEGSCSPTVNDDRTSALNGQAEFLHAWRLFQKEHPEASLKLPKWQLPADAQNPETMLYTRMLFSCLVDADYSVSAWEDDHSYFEKTRSAPLDAAACLEQLNRYRDALRRNSTANTELNRLRDQVFDLCGERGEREPSGLFTLTAPTGIGKTLALLHFALRHTLAQKKKRIIIVLPFLTLAEQNTATYAQIVPSVLVDHSQSRMPPELWQFAEKWNVPFIITTSVKFFETLFARKPTDCRKLHSIAESVVVFDEAQSLPPQLTCATLKVVNELCARYRMSMVFSTATQPDFDAIPNLSWHPREILPEHPALYTQLRRTQVDWQLGQRIPLESIARQMLERTSVCGIFNLRRHARAVFEQLCAEDPDSAFLISTDLCPAHRTKIINTIRARLSSGLPCRVAATQCIEAGVDLDFNALFRALAPLDSIIQAAGRCNRNGSPTPGTVLVFEPDEARLYPDDRYSNAAELVKELVNAGGIDIHDPNDIRRYYQRLFANAQDDPKLTKALAERNYAQVDECYRLIPKSGEKLIVPYCDNETHCRALCAELLKNGLTPGHVRDAAALTVTVYDDGSLEKYAEPIFTRSRYPEERVRSGYWVLRPQYEDLYTENGGLKLPEKGHSADSFSF